MQLKECMEDTADNKVWGDWMLINLCVLCSVQYCCRSSSLLSCSWLSRPPLKGMTKAPGSWLSTHSLIFTNLVKKKKKKKSAATKTCLKEDLINTRVCVICRCMHIHDSSWTNIRVFAGDCAPKMPISFRVGLCFHKSFQLEFWFDFVLIRQSTDSRRIKN